MVLLSKVWTFLMVRVNKESCLGFLALIRAPYLLRNLLYLFSVQTLQILRPQLREKVWSFLQFLHSKTTKSVPQLANRSARWELQNLRILAISRSILPTVVLPTETKFSNILAYLHHKSRPCGLVCRSIQ